MDNRLFDELIGCTVKVLVGTRIGTGFFVAPGQVLTCLHVIGDMRGEAAVLWQGQKYQAEVVLPGQAGVDLALLKVAWQDHPCVYLGSGSSPFDKLYTYGYSDEYPCGDSVTLEFEGWSGGEIGLLKTKAGQVRPGLSGAPLLNISTGMVCGIVKRSRGRTTALGGRAIPAEQIFSTFPQLSSLQAEFHNRYPRWSGLLPSDDVATGPDRVRPSLVRVIFQLLAESDIGWEAEAAESLLNRAQSLYGPYGVDMQHTMLSQAEAADWAATLSQEEAITVILVNRRLSRTASNVILESILGSKKHTSIILMFDRSPGDVYNMDSGHLAGIKQLRDAALDLGIMYYDYRSEKGFRETFWYWLCKSLDARAIILAPEEKPERSRTKKISPCYVHSVPQPKLHITRSSVEDLVEKEMRRENALIVMTGIGGTGKTTLAYTCATRVFQQSSTYRGLLWFSFNDVGSEGPTLMLTALCDYLGKEQLLQELSREPGLIKNALLKELSDTPYLVVLDGLEVMQVQDPSNAKYGEIQDRLLRDFLVGVTRQRCSTFLVTSRTAPVDMLQAAGCVGIPISGFSPKQALEYLRRSNLRGSEPELEKIAEHFGYHPLALSMMSQYVTRYYEGDGSRMLKDLTENPNSVLSERLGLLLEEYWKHLSRQQQLMLTFISISPGAITAEEAMHLEAVWQEGVGKLDHSFIIDLGLLAELGFVTVNIHREAGTREFRIHPVLRALIENSLSNPNVKRLAAQVYAIVESVKAEELGPENPASLDALAHEIQFLLDGGRISDAINLFINQRANVIFFEAGRHDLGIPLGERMYGLTEQYNIPRPTADYLSGYLPDHYSSYGRIRSAVRLMKEIPLDDNWTALSDQIWILLRGGELKYAREVYEKVPDWRRGRQQGWELAQLLHYEGNRACLENFRAVITELTNLLPSYSVRLLTQYATALADFGEEDQAEAVIEGMPSLVADEPPAFPLEQVHTELMRARLKERSGNISDALAMVENSIKVSRVTGDDFGLLRGLIQKVRIYSGVSTSYQEKQDNAEQDIRDELIEIQQILRVTGEGDSWAGFPVEGVQFCLLSAVRAQALGNEEEVSTQLSMADDLVEKCGNFWCRATVVSVKELLAV